MTEREVADACRRVAELRSRGDVGAALAELNAVAGEHLDRVPVLRESFRLCLALEAPQRAFSLYGCLREIAAVESELGASGLARLQIELPGHPVPELGSGDLELDAVWAGTYLDSGVDPVRDLSLATVRVDNPTGAVSYELGGACPWCGAAQIETIRLHLFVDRARICPGCLGRWRLDSGTVCDFLVERYPALTSDDAYGWYSTFIPLARTYSARPDARELPLLTRYQSQLYAFYLSQLVTRRLVEDGP